MIGRRKSTTVYLVFEEGEDGMIRPAGWARRDPDKAAQFARKLATLNESPTYVVPVQAFEPDEPTET